MGHLYQYALTQGSGNIVEEGREVCKDRRVEEICVKCCTAVLHMNSLQHELYKIKQNEGLVPKASTQTEELLADDGY